MIIFPTLIGVSAKNDYNRATSFISDKGEVKVFTDKDVKTITSHVIFFRGIVFLLYGLYFFVSGLFKSYENKKEKNVQTVDVMISQSLGVSHIAVFVSMIGILGLIIGIVFLSMFPLILNKNLINAGINKYVTALIIAIIRTIALYALFCLLKLIPSMKQYYRFNAAGNVIINEKIGEPERAHHVSVNYLNFLINGFLLSIFMVSFTVFPVHYVLRLLINLAITIFCFSIAYELLNMLKNRKESFFKFLIFSTSFLVTEEPTQTEIHIARVAVTEVLLMDENESRMIENKDTDKIFMSVVLSEVKNKLRGAGIEDDSESEWLIAETLGMKRNDIKLRTEVTKEEYKKIKNVCMKREKRMPLSKIFGRINFYGLDFEVDKNVLSPRMETELLVEEAIKIIVDEKLEEVLDLCTGSGIIAVCIAKNVDAKIMASDKYSSAIEIAKNNADNNGVKIKFVESDIFDKLKRHKFDMIVSNPPYIKSNEIICLEDEVKKYDPVYALDGGEDGLYFYRKIIEEAPEHLSKGGYLLFEVGSDQATNVKKLLQKDFKNIRIRKDYFGIERIVIAKLNK